MTATPTPQTPRPSHADWSAVSPEDLLVEHIGRTENTSRAYAGDLRRFAAYIGAAGNVETVKQLVSMPRGQVVLTLRQYQRHLQARSESDYTVRRYIASLLGLLKLAHELFVIEWAIRYRLPRVPEAPAVRSRRIPTREEILDMMSMARRREDAKGLRDNALLHLLYFSALRRHEVLGLDVGHLDLSALDIRVKTKGRRQRQHRPIAPQTAHAVGMWLAARGEADGALFTSLERGIVKAGAIKRLTGEGIYDIIYGLGRKVGMEHCSPHRLRHAGATHLGQFTRGSLMFGIALTGHRDPKTYLIYDGNRYDQMRAATEILAAGQYVYTVPDDGLDKQ